MTPQQRLGAAGALLLLVTVIALVWWPELELLRMPVANTEGVEGWGAKKGPSQPCGVCVCPRCPKATAPGEAAGGAPCPPCPEASPVEGGGGTPGAVQSASGEEAFNTAECEGNPACLKLFAQWGAMFVSPPGAEQSTGFKQYSTLLPAGVAVPSVNEIGLDSSSLPFPPHLQDCDYVEQRWVSLETRGPNREDPEWVAKQQPHWIPGEDKDNMKGTRAAQTKLWQHQHPPDCSDPEVKLVFARWGRDLDHGIGSQLHTISDLIDNAITQKRVVVLEPWPRANHSGCPDSAFGCYFPSFVSQECEQEVQREIERVGGVDNLPVMAPEETARVVKGESPEFCRNYQFERDQEGWDYYEANREGSLEMGGRSLGELQGFSWWRAQAVSYLLRVPSNRLCRLMNQMRHESFGMEVALRVLEGRQRQVDAQSMVVDLGGRGDQGYQEGNPQVRGGPVSDPPRSENPPFELSLWRDLPVYMPRPIVSMHVRLGDKGFEMRLYGVPEFMWHAERIRNHDPSLKAVWFSTEAQEALRETSNFKHWRFYYSNVPRAQGNGSLTQFMSTMVQTSTDNALTNLMLALECDYFIGTLQSNWNRLIDELRKTRGRYRAGHVVLNVAEC